MSACGWAVFALEHGRLPRARWGLAREWGSQGASTWTGSRRAAAGCACCDLEVLARVVLLIPGVPKWRNWQTRYIQGVVPVRAWRFESSLRHITFLFIGLSVVQNV